MTVPFVDPDDLVFGFHDEEEPAEAYPPDEVLFGDPRGEDLDDEYEQRTVNVEDVPLLDRFGGTVL